MNDEYLKLVGGLAFLAVGAGMIAKRDACARWNGKAIRAIWGPMSNRVARSSTPRTLVLVAVVFLTLGSVFAITSLASLAG